MGEGGGRERERRERERERERERNPTLKSGFAFSVDSVVTQT